MKQDVDLMCIDMLLELISRHFLAQINACFQAASYRVLPL